MASITGTSAGDILTGTGVADTVRGLGGDDRLDGGGGSDSVDGGDGNDTIFGHAGDTLKGSLGTDLLVVTSFAAAANFDFSLISAAATATVTANGSIRVSGFEWLEVDTGGFNDTIVTGDFSDLVSAGGGNDNISTGFGDDFVKAGAGDDTVDGGDGFDRIGYGDSANGVSVNLRLQGTAQNTGVGMDVLIGFENVSGSAFGDTIIGDENNNILEGVGTAADSLFGAEGDDLLLAINGAHTLNGGDGIDVLSVYGADTSTGVAINLDLQGNTPQATGIGSMVLKNLEGLSGTVRNDALTGDFHDNLLAGVDGADTLIGAAGDDTLWGDGQVKGDFAFGLSGPALSAEALYGTDATPGADVLDGGNGDDVLVGGGGADTITGGAGATADAFWYFRLEDSLVTAQDVLTDFSQIYDILDVSAIDADVNTEGDQAFTLVSAFSHTAGEARVTWDRDLNESDIAFDVDGDAVADMQIHILGRVSVVGLNDPNFIA